MENKFLIEQLKRSRTIKDDEKVCLTFAINFRDFCKKEDPENKRDTYALMEKFGHFLNAPFELKYPDL